MAETEWVTKEKWKQIVGHLEKIIESIEQIIEVIKTC